MQTEPYDQYRDHAYNQPIQRPAPTAVAIANEPVTVQDEKAMAWLRVTAYVVVILTCVLVAYSIVRMWLALDALGDSMQQITQTWGN